MMKNVYRSNMAVMEVNFPSGYKVDLYIFKKSPHKYYPIKRFETNIDQTVLTVYFDYVCIQVFIDLKRFRNDYVK